MLSAAVIHNDNDHTQRSVADSQKIKHRGNFCNGSCSTSNYSSQVQELNIPDIFVNSLSHNTQSWKQGLLSQYDSLLFIVEFGVQIHNFVNGSGTLSSISLPIGPRDSGLEISRILIFHQKCCQVAKSHQIVAKLLQALSLQWSHKGWISC